MRVELTIVIESGKRMRRFFTQMATVVLCLSILCMSITPVALAKASDEAQPLGSGVDAIAPLMWVDVDDAPDVTAQTAQQMTSEAAPEVTPDIAPALAKTNKVYPNVKWPIDAPAVNAAGYLNDGEYVYQSEEEGVWFYASPSLIVRIDRYVDEENVLTWYEANVYCDLDSDVRFGSILNNPDKPSKEHVQAAKIAREKQVVFGMNSDYYTYRIGRKATVGMIIRGGTVLFDRVPKTNRSKFPNLDTLAMFGDGSWGVYHSDELTAEEYLSKGATDVYAFGPYLIRDGQLNEYIEKMGSGKTDQPRCALGMVEPGHYVGILAEGRIRNVSKGVSISALAQMMLDAGCVQALNLDGGQTAVMTFMGEQVTRIGKYNGGKTNARTTTEIVGIGRSALIQTEIDK